MLRTFVCEEEAFEIGTFSLARLSSAHFAPSGYKIELCLKRSDSLQKEVLSNCFDDAKVRQNPFNRKKINNLH